MLARILGSAAGGGVPQWNCGCEYCAAAFSDRSLARSGCSVAVSGNGAEWTILNAAAELPSQLASFETLRPSAGIRTSPFAAIVLTDAEIDHVIGLLMLRQAGTLTVAATATVLSLLERSGLAGLLGGYVQVTWREITAGADLLVDPSGLRVRAIPVGAGKQPRYAGPDPGPADATVGLVISESSGESLLYAPCVPALTDELLDACRSCSLILLDGTFFSDDELVKAGGHHTARELGHLPVGGPDGSLAQLERDVRSRVVYTHLNNTNPLLDAGSDASDRVRRAGAAIAADGAEYEL